ncbi:hypothetical protein F2P81_014430 [Scophthalmus maximus]|uniref:Annexin n=1 Tax=Scophthalmus maximus TaxID=52904 RepID=A0A6A4STK2_SCOMX|nr:hypothetical protein F2P81_014430 [Scophthalmus maximus]
MCSFSPFVPFDPSSPLNRVPIRRHRDGEFWEITLYFWCYHFVENYYDAIDGMPVFGRPGVSHGFRLVLVLGRRTKDKVLIDILTQRSCEQRQLIAEAYQDATGSALQDDLEGETRGDFEDVLVALVSTPAAYDCHEVMRAMKGAGSKDDILIEIFASRTNEQIKALSDVYLNEKENLLIKDLRKEVGGDFSKALFLLAEGERDESTGVDVDGAKEDAQALYEASEKKWGTDESAFIEILCQRSEAQLRQIFVEYKSISGKTLQHSIEGEMSGELEELLVAIVKCVKSRPAYFAERLHESMKSDLSGDHGDCVLAICGGDDGD